MTTTVLAYIPSPAQGVWHLGPFPLRAYALFIVAGIIAALVLGDRRWAARGGEPGVIYDVALWAVPFGLIGGRVYHVMTDWRTYFGDDGAGLVAAFRIWDGGLGIWGAVALGGVGAWIACRRHEIPLPAFGDAIAPGIVLAQAIGRLGNYFNQELYGRSTTLPWGLEIYERRNAGGVLDSLNGVSTGELIDVVHPTFLYELLWNLLVFAALILIDRRFRIGHGRLFAMYVAGYCLGRFWIELMRSDTATLLAGIRINAFTATFVFIGAVVYIMSAPKGREDPATLRGAGDGVEEGGRAEDLAKDLVVAASGTGVVAAAKVAGEDDEKSVAEAVEVEALAADLEAEPAEVEAEPAKVESGGLGSVEGDEVVGAVDGAPAVHDDAVAAEFEAETLAADVAAETEDPETDVAAEDLESVDADAVAEDGAEAGELDGLDADSSGLGSVEGDEMAGTFEGASVVHAAAIAGGSDAKQLAAEVEAEPEVSEPDADGAEDGAEGLGLVEGEESAAAVEDATVVHDGAGEGDSVAEDLAAEVETEVKPDVDVPEVSEPEPDVDEPDVDSAEDGAEGLGLVEGEESAAVVEDATVVRDGAVEGESAAEELSAEGEAEAEAEPEVSEPEVEPEPDVVEPDVDSAEDDAEGLGLVEGEESAAVVEDATVVHDGAVEDESAAEDLGAEVEAEPDGDVPEVSEPEPDVVEPEVDGADAEGLGSVEGEESAAAVEGVTVVRDGAGEGDSVAEDLVAEAEAELGADEAEAVAADETGGVVDDAPAVHDDAAEVEAETLEESLIEAEQADAGDDPVVAVEGASVADALTADVDAEAPGSGLAGAGDSSESIESDIGLDEDAVDPQQVAVEGASVAEALTAEVEPERGGSESTEASVSPESASGTGNSEMGGRVREWLRRRRSR